MKKYEQIENTNKSLKIEVYYHKGGMNYYNYQVEKRGYYLSVCPVEIKRENGYSIESFMAFSGVKRLLLEVGRKSDKAYGQAVNMLEQHLPELRTYILSKVN